MRSWAILLICALLGGCASAPPPAPLNRQMLADSAFEPPSERIDAAEVFALSDAMRHYLRTDIARQLRIEGRQRGLIDALYQHNQLKLDYDASITRTAAQAFDARAGNCLSLVIMTAAFAKELGVQVTFQSAWTEEAWLRSGDLYFRSGHVNVTLGKRITDVGSGFDLSSITIDFLPQQTSRTLRTSAITEQRVLAMYMNNRAAEALVQGHIADAYWWAREGIVQDPGFMSVVNTLGVIYRRHGDPQRSEAVFRHVLAQEPANTRAMSNLAQLLDQLGRSAEASDLKARLAQLEPDPPFYYFNLGLAAMQRDDFKTARDLFAKEVDRADYYHEFHFWLGLASFKLGDYDAARKQLALAMENSANRGDRDLYAAKLAWLKAQQH
ncbi:MAG TPA: tetratricopeptide repeat protein [Albitalea sp.]|nr:tetratricopeptide repeat protein [Albitalea sp.]